MRNVCAVAHPDDEVMWFGGLILSEPGDWTIICLSVPHRDSIRGWKFFEACERLGARGQLVPCVEPGSTQPLQIEVLDLLDLDRYDRIVTHGREGEYGHLHHKQVSAYIRERWRDKTIWERAPNGGGERVLTLRPAIAERKLHALRAYDHVLPYTDGRMMTKWEALLKRYGDDWGFDVEWYRCSVAADGQR